MHFLFWCAFDNISFRIPEFESICKLFGIPLNWVAKNDTYPWIILDLASGILLGAVSTDPCSFELRVIRTIPHQVDQYLLYKLPCHTI